MKFYEQWVEDNPDLPVYDLHDLIKEIAYAYEEQYGIQRDKEGIFYVYKLAIGSNWAQYKEHVFKLEPGVYAQLVKFFEVENVE